MINQRTDTNWTPLDAILTIEGEQEHETSDYNIEAWAYLISTGTVWSLQGFYGRCARALINGGAISKDGTIDWEIVDSVDEEDL
jgi:hypothetical protein